MTQSNTLPTNAFPVNASDARIHAREDEARKYEASDDYKRALAAASAAI